MRSRQKNLIFLGKKRRSHEQIHSPWQMFKVTVNKQHNYGMPCLTFANKTKEAPEQGCGGWKDAGQTASVLSFLNAL